MFNKPLFVTGIGTDVGKTIVSAVLVEQLKADYWKPVQAGDLHHTDSHKIQQLIVNMETVVHPERYRLKMAASPHKAAKAEGITISPEDFTLPSSCRPLLIEGAGGLFVPLSDTFLMIDLIAQFDAEIVLVARDYLGCINHTLLSIDALTSRGLKLKHVIFNGEFDLDTLDVIISHIPLKTTFSELPEFQACTRYAIACAPIQIPIKS